MRNKLISCAVAGALVLSVPATAGAVTVGDLTYLGNQVTRLQEQLALGVSAEEHDLIDEQIDELLAEMREQGADTTAFEEADAQLDALYEDPGTEETSAAEGAAEDAEAESPVEVPADEATDQGEGVADEDAMDDAADEDAADPADPVDPETPADPVDPVDPVEPVDPTDPDDSAEDETQPTDPVQPTEPTDPAAEAPAAEQPVEQQDAVQPARTLPLTPSVTFDSGTPQRYNYSEDLDTEKFIALIGEQARSIGQEYGLYASVMIAQAVLESGSGQSDLSQAPYNNLFGIKGTWEDEDGNAHGVSMLTSEDTGSGTYYQIVSEFRAYDTISDSLADYAELLTEDMGTFYAGAWKENAETYADAAQYLEGRYATDTSYAEKLLGLIETYELDRFDEALDYTPVDEDVDLSEILAEATAQIGTPYVWGGTTPEQGFDCSGLVQYAYQEGAEIELSRTTYTQCLEGETVQFDDLHPGDLLFFEREGDVHHVAIYLGDGFYLHAPQAGELVKVTSMEEYEPSFAKRIVATRPVEQAPVVAAVLLGTKAAVEG